MWNWDWFDFPNLVTVLLDGAIRTELTTASYALDSHLVPLCLISIGCVNSILSIYVVVKIVTDKVLVVAVCQIVN